MTAKRAKLIGWGFEGDEITTEEREMVMGRITERYGGDLERQAPPTAEEIELHAPRLDLPPVLADFATIDRHERLLHTYGKAVPDYVRIFERNFKNAPDIVVYVRDEADIEAVLEWAAGAGVAVIPFGGGTSV